MWFSFLDFLMNNYKMSVIQFFTFNAKVFWRAANILNIANVKLYV